MTIGTILPTTSTIGNLLSPFSDKIVAFNGRDGEFWATPHIIVADMSDLLSRSIVASQTYAAYQDNPHVPVVIFTTSDAYGMAAAYSSGADYVCTTFSHLEIAIKDAANTLPARAALPKRQAQILFAFATGRSTQMAATEMYLSPQTVKTYTKDLFAILEANTRLTAIQKAFHLGLLPSAREIIDITKFPLTYHETRAIYALAETGSRESAAELLGLRPTTIKTHIQNVRARTGWGAAQALSNIWWWGAFPDFHVDKMPNVLVS